MRNLPSEIPDELLIRELASGWGIEVTNLEYLPVGFGAYHWDAVDANGRRVFVSVGLVDDQESAAENQAALMTARHLADSGFTGLAAPLRGLDGDVVRTASTTTGAERAISVVDFVRGQTYVDADVRRPDEVVALLADLHGRTDQVRDVAIEDTPAIRHRAALTHRLGTLTNPWHTGPLGERTRALALANADLISEALGSYDRLRAAMDPDGWVITHGEPNERNLMLTDAGLVLVDWDTARIAPAARDLWDLDDPAMLEVYAELTGHRPAAGDLLLFQLRWDLEEIGEYVDEFAQPHEPSADADEGFDNLVESLGKLPASVDRAELNRNSDDLF